MKTIITTLLLIFTLTAFSQKKVDYNKNNDIITVNGKPYAKMIRSNADSEFPFNKDFLFTDLEGNEILLMKLKKMQRFDRWNRLVEEKIGYQFFFLDTETRNTGFKVNTMGAKGAAKLFVRNKLLKDGKLDQKAKKLFLAKYRSTLTPYE